MPDLLRLCAFEGTQIRGETLPLDAQVATKGKMGMVVRIPCGVVLAIVLYAVFLTGLIARRSTTPRNPNIHWEQLQ